MKHPVIYNILAAVSFLLAGSFSAFAKPIDFNEVSLLVRAHESENSIKDDVAHRKLFHQLTPQQESTLKSQGASDSLISSLRNSNYILSKEEAAAFETVREQKAKTPGATAAEETAASQSEAGGKLYVFDVGFGHPINLSEWGGYDCELAFYSYRCAGEDIVQPFFVDPVRTVSVVTRSITQVSEAEAFANNGLLKDSFRPSRFMPYDNDGHRFTPYDAGRDLKDSRFNFSDTVSVSSRSASRPLAIDWNNPVVIKGVPYTLYRVYGEGGVSLYYIGNSIDSVKLAVTTAR
jgi:hypothetical protein